MKDLLNKYPYFAYAALQELKQTDSPEEREHLKAVLAANIGSESDLREMLGLNTESLVDFYPDSITPTLTTNDTIDVFLDRFGAKEETLTPAPAFDYASTLIPDADTPLPDLGLPADSPFLNPTATPTSTHIAPPSAAPAQEPPASDTPVAEGLTESFAKILIKNRNYTKALEIIEQLNLKNPEKSIYFADQIRFLKKLIITQSKSTVARH